MTPVVCWSSVAGFDGQLSWIPEDFTSVPAKCVCGELLKLTELAHDDDSPIEMTCARGHIWRATQKLLEERIASKLEERPRCRRCGEFLSATRVEMRIDRCAKCDVPRGKATR